MVAAAPSTATATAALEELDLKLRASEAEREELVATVHRLQATLAERDAEVALARDGSTGTRGDIKRVNKLIADAESRAVMAEKKAAAAEEDPGGGQARDRHGRARARDGSAAQRGRAAGRQNGDGARRGLIELPQQIHGVCRQESGSDRPRRQDPRHPVPVPAAELEVRFAQRNHATAAMPNDDLTVPRRSPPPQREAQVAHKSQALRVREGSAEPVLVLHDPTPQADRPEDRRVAGPPERVGARDGMEAARAMELGSDVRSVAGAGGGCGPSGRPGLAVAGDRSEPNIRSVPRAHQGPRSPGLDRFDQSRDRGLEPDGCHRLSGRIGFGTSGLGGRRFEIGNLVGQGERYGLDFDDPLGSTDVHGCAPRAFLEPSSGPERTPAVRRLASASETSDADELVDPVEVAEEDPPPGPISNESVLPPWLYTTEWPAIASRWSLNTMRVTSPLFTAPANAAPSLAWPRRHPSQNAMPVIPIAFW